MTILRSAASVLALHAAAFAFPAFANSDVALDTEPRKISYAIGSVTGRNLDEPHLGFNLDVDAFIAGLRATIGTADPKMTDEEIKTTLDKFVSEIKAKQKALAPTSQSQKEATGMTFMEENSKKDGVITTASGLQYMVVKTGEGDSPTLRDTVSVHYTGRLLNGDVFDSSHKRGQPAEFPVSGVIPGWTEALQLMQPGGQLEVWIPSELAYGERGAGSVIGPNEVLNFDMDLLAIIK
ncbi:MAG: FKBP-type peptidyl-prolyl cis-trans isomerase [Alphaproteobacteria bacterium]